MNQKFYVKSFFPPEEAKKEKKSCLEIIPQRVGYS